MPVSNTKFSKTGVWCFQNFIKLQNLGNRESGAVCTSRNLGPSHCKDYLRLATPREMAGTARAGQCRQHATSGELLYGIKSAALGGLPVQCALPMFLALDIDLKIQPASVHAQ